MSTGIVSSKEGHDESHINDMKLRTKFWNDVNKVTIRLTQKYWHRDCSDCRGKLLQLPFEHRRHEKRLGSMTTPYKHTVQQWTMHSFEILKGVTWLMKVDRLVGQLNTQLTEWYTDKCHVQRWLSTAIGFAKWFPSLNSPIMIDECLFSFLRVQRR